MSIFRNDTLGSWTRGGQAIVHNVRMTTQVFFQTSLASSGMSSKNPATISASSR